jgi:protein ImuB
VPRVPPTPLERAVDFEQGLDRVDQIAFALRPIAEDFVEGLRREGLACTELRVQITDDEGHRSERCWGHPRHFSAGDVVDRMRWQLQAGEADVSPAGAWRTTGDALAAPVVQIRLLPERTDKLGLRGQALFGGVDERLDHGLRRLQSMLGHDSVLHPVAAGGRLLAERCLMIPWGEDAPSGTAAIAEQPWPGAVPAPLPATVFPEPVPVQLLDARAEPLRVDARGELEGAPTWFCPNPPERQPPEGQPPERRRAIRSWAGPWPLRQRWGVAALARRADRFQIVDDDGDAWLLLGSDGSWWAEARYD